MIAFRDLPDDHPALACSPLLRAARLTLTHMATTGPIGLTKTKAFKRTFVHWAAEHFEWPGSGHEELFRYHKVLNEADFPQLELLHFLLLALKLGRRYKDEFRVTKQGETLSQSQGALFRELIPFYVLQIDHSSYARLDENPLGNWDVWLNVINAEMENGISERELFGTFYGDGPDWGNAGWRQMAAFSNCVLKPLEWSGLMTIHETEDAGRPSHMCFKTPLWRAVLKLDTDDMLKPSTVH